MSQTLQQIRKLVARGEDNEHEAPSAYCGFDSGRDLCTMDDVSATSRQLPATLLDEIVRRVVAVAHSYRIVLFGSAARGDMGPHSDVDLLVIKSAVPHRRRLAQQIHQAFFGLGSQSM